MSILDQHKLRLSIGRPVAITGPKIQSPRLPGSTTQVALGFLLETALQKPPRKKKMHKNRFAVGGNIYNNRKIRTFKQTIYII